jgi:type VII secretion protein EccB
MATWSRREQHHAYRFVTRRIVSAILTAEPETSELPMRRFTMTLVGSAGLALLVITGFFVYGLIFPGGGRPAENVIIVERETGANYLYLRGRLHPVLNWTSARLLLGQAQPPVRTMSRNSLRDVPRGRAVGIPGLPDTLPERGSLVGLPWSVCSAPRSLASVEIATHVLVGQVPQGGAALDDNEGVLVTLAPTAQRFLVWRDHRLRVPDNAVLAALGWAAVRPAPVSAAFLDALPPGPDVTPLRVPGAGSPARTAVAGQPTRIGQLFRSAEQHYVTVADGLAPVGALTARLLVAGGAAVTEVSAADVGRVLVNTAVEPPGTPAEIPAAHGSDDRFAMACAIYRGSAEIERPVVVESFAAVDPALAQADPAVPRVAPGGGALADQVLLPGGRGALVATLMPPESPAVGNVYVLTDQGVKYPVPRGSTGGVLSALGYEGVAPVAVPASILALLPTGPALDPEAARSFVDPETVELTPPASG